jgi:hypothetical protein
VQEDFDEHGHLVLPSVIADLAEAVDKIIPENVEGARSLTWDGQPFVPATGLPQAMHDGPFPHAELNAILVDHRVLDIAEELLGEPPVLAQWHLWARYPNPGYQDQSLHVDYMNHTMLIPDSRPGFRYVQMIAYLTDIGLADAPTYVVDRALTHDLPLVPYKLEREQHSQLYDLERPVLVPHGSLLAFSSDTWHRGSAFQSAEGRRIAMHFTYKTAEAGWNGHTIIHSHAFRPSFGAMLAALDARQRSALGFPPSGHPYWTPRTLEATKLRYPEMSLEEYSGSW